MSRGVMAKTRAPGGAKQSKATLFMQRMWMKTDNHNSAWFSILGEAILGLFIGAWK